MRAHFFVLLLIFCAGCLAPGSSVDQVGSVGRDELPPTIIHGTIAPEGPLVPPWFRNSLTLTEWTFTEGGGEPGLATSLDGSLFLTFPGCPQRASSPTDAPQACASGALYKSEDAGRTWIYINGPEGQLSRDAKFANSDADVAVDANGTIYVTNLGEGVHFQRSSDGGITWESGGNLVTADPPRADRQWMAAASPGHVIVTWMDLTGGRRVAAKASFDGGLNFTQPAYFGENIGWHGSVTFSPDGRIAYVPYTEHPPFGLGQRVPGDCSLWIAKSLDGGKSWLPVDTGVKIHAANPQARWSCLFVAPSLSVTGNGAVALAFSAETHDPLGLVATGASVQLVTSSDEGRTWTVPRVVNSAPSGVMPWVTAGAGGRAAVTYFANRLPGDVERGGIWDLVTVSYRDVGDASGEKTEVVVAQEVHVGGICGQGATCFDPVEDRSLAEFFETTILPDGMLVIAYPATTTLSGRTVEIRVAVQEGGTPLLVRPPSDQPVG